MQRATMHAPQKRLYPPGSRTKGAQTLGPKTESRFATRNGKAAGIPICTSPAFERGPDWSAHFGWLRKQGVRGGGVVKELEADRLRHRTREQALGNLQ